MGSRSHWVVIFPTNMELPHTDELVSDFLIIGNLQHTVTVAA